MNNCIQFVKCLSRYHLSRTKRSTHH